MVAVSPLAMLRSLALGQAGFAVPQVQRAAVAPPPRSVAPVAPAAGPPATEASTGGAPSPDAVAMPRMRPMAPSAPSGGSYNLPAKPSMSSLRDMLTSAAMGTISVPQGTGIVGSLAGGFAGARKYQSDKAAGEAEAARNAEKDRLDAEYKRAQIENLQRQGGLTDSQQDYQFYVDQEQTAGREPLSYFDFKKTVGKSDAGQTERIVEALRLENPGLSYSEALALAQRSPDKSAESLRRESLAMTAAKEDADFSIEPEATLNKWRKYYGLEGDAPVKPKKKKGGKNKDKPATDSAPPAQSPAARPRAVNPDTGEALVWDGKAWVPE